MTKTPNENLPLIHLIGDATENFYQLGLKDKSSFSQVSDHSASLLLGNNDIFKPFLQLSIPNFFARTKSPLQDWTKAYCEGLEVPLSKVKSLFLIPEILCSMHKWIPHLSQIQLGCSSLFTLGEQGQIHHGRVLDFPLIALEGNNERVVHYKFLNYQECWSVGQTAMPFPGLSAMNGSGISFALHQKFNKLLNLTGTSIFEILTKLALETTNKKEILKILKKFPSIASWGLYISLPSGEVLEIDLLGDEINLKEYKLEEKNPCLYFNNIPQKKVECLPYAINNWCEMRKDMAQRKISKTLTKKQPLSHHHVLTILGTPLKRKVSAKNWQQDCVTPTSLHIISMNPAKGELALTPGNPPKFYQGRVTLYSHLWKKVQVINKKYRKIPINPNYAPFIEQLGKSITHFDTGKKSEGLHHLQMAIQFAKGHPEKNIYQFFFLAHQYLIINKQKDYQYLLREFEHLLGELPSHLNDHCHLFIQRIYILLENPMGPKVPKFSNSIFEKIYHHESKLAPSALKLFKHLTFIRIDILDILYAYY